jgi:hypothetical protein
MNTSNHNRNLYHALLFFFHVISFFEIDPPTTEGLLIEPRLNYASATRPIMHSIGASTVMFNLSKKIRVKIAIAMNAILFLLYRRDAKRFHFLTAYHLFEICEQLILNILLILRLECF